MLIDQTQQRLQLEVWQLQKPSKVVQLLREIGGGILDEKAQYSLLDCVKNPVSQRFSPGNLYLDRLLKALVVSAEKEEEALIDDLAGLHQHVLLEPPKSAGPMELPASWCYKTYSYGVAGTEMGSCDQKTACKAAGATGLITLHVSQNLLEGSTGCHEWEAGFVLAEYIFSHPSLFQGSSCCELGCGPGTVGIALQRVGAGSILLTDGDAETLLNCKHNLGINNVIVKDGDSALPSQTKGVEMAQIQWENGGSLDAEVFLGADLLYDPGSHAALVQVIVSSLRGSGTAEQKQMILATTMRDETSIASFFALLQESRLHAESLGDGDLQSMGIRFQHHLELESMRGSILLHRITGAFATR